MDPITELQMRVEWIVTATIDTVQLLASEGQPDAGKVRRALLHCTGVCDLYSTS